LFERGSRSVRLADVGQRFLPRARACHTWSVWHTLIVITSMASREEEQSAKGNRVLPAGMVVPGLDEIARPEKQNPPPH
jgi:hypothetical protein